jgi:hypothetical protein
MTLGDLLTLVSVLVSAAGLAWTWHQDIATRQREQTTDVRKAAATTLAKLDRVGELVELLFDDIQPIIIDTTDQLADKHDPALARDVFWKSVTAARLLHRKRFMDEQIESAYVGLYSYMQDARGMFRDTVQHLRSEEDSAVENILQGCQSAILAYDRQHVQSYQPAALGNTMRDVVSRERDAYLKPSAATLADIQARLARIVAARDDEILAGLNDKSL